MEVCDALSRRVGTIAQGTAIVEGALTGAGGVWTTLLDVPLLFTLCIRTIIKTGHCYGYALDRPTDKAWVLGALAVALSSTKERRTELMARLREIEDLLLEETQEQVVVEETASLLTQIEVFEDIPVFGAVTGGLLNLSVAHRADVTARHLFQERWLRDQGKVDEIEPSPDASKAPSLTGMVGRLLAHRLQHHLRRQFRRGIPGLSPRRGLRPGHRFDPLGVPRRGQGGDRRSRRLARARPPAGMASPGPHSKEARGLRGGLGLGSVHRARSSPRGRSETSDLSEIQRVLFRFGSQEEDVMADRQSGNSTVTAAETSASRDGSVTVSREQLIELLNEDLAREYQAIIAYVVYSQVLKGAAVHEHRRGAGDARRGGAGARADHLQADRLPGRHADRRRRSR